MICVLLAAAGAAWESEAIGALADTRDLVLLKRCVDVDDLMASATAGQVEAAVIALDAPGLDAATLDHLRRHGVTAVVVAPSTPEATARVARLGAPEVVDPTALGALPGHLRAAVQAAGPQTDAAPPAVAPDASDTPQGAGRVWTVWGPAGAPGRTTIAGALAAVLARGGRRVTLVDADPWGGTVAQHWGVLDPASGLLTASRALAGGAGSVADQWPSIARRVTDGLDLVSGLPRADRWSEVRPGTLDLVLDTAAARGDVVVDTGFSLEEDPAADLGGRPGRNALTLTALDAADELWVVGSADPVGLARLARGLADLREGLTSSPVEVLVNRDRPSLGWQRSDVTDLVGGFDRVRGVHFLPDDRASVDRAVVRGQLLTEVGSSPLVSAVERVVAGMLPAAGRRRGGRTASGLRWRTGDRARRR